MANFQSSEIFVVINNVVRIKILKNEDGRHESLNETNRYQIYDEILQWLNDNVVVK